MAEQNKVSGGFFLILFVLLAIINGFFALYPAITFSLTPAIKNFLFLSSAVSFGPFLWVGLISSLLGIYLVVKKQARHKKFLVFLFLVSIISLIWSLLTANMAV